MAEVKRGEIWLADLDPTVGHEINKTRPTVIIQNDTGNLYSPTTIVAPLTTKKLDNIRVYEVFLGGKRFGLTEDSKVLLSQIKVVDKSRLIKKLGTLDHDTMLKVDEAIKISLGLIKIS